MCAGLCKALRQIDVLGDEKRLVRVVGRSCALCYIFWQVSSVWFHLLWQRGPPNLAEACGIEWNYDAYATDASDDHQSVAGTPSDDMDVAGDGEDESESSADDDKMWLLPKVNIPDEPQSRKCTYTHRIT